MTQTLGLEQSVASARAYMESERFKGIARLHSPRQVAEQRGTIQQDYAVARQAAEGFYARLRELFEQRKHITTFGPYSPSQAVMMKRAGLEGIYLGGWATSAKGSTGEDPGADLASYPLSQVPNEAASIVRALLTADKNQQYRRFQMSAEERAQSPVYDFRPFIIADADTGHGGDAHVRNLIRRFVEVGVPGYHIEDQRPGTKKCGHQGGKVLVSCDEQIKRLNAARLQLDIMGVPGIIVARTDAEAATLMDNLSDERDQPFVLGATNTDIPSYKAAVIAMQKALFDAGATEIKGYQLYSLPAVEMESANHWLRQCGMMETITMEAAAMQEDSAHTTEAAYDRVLNALVKAWESAAGLKTYRQAVADRMQLLINEGMGFDMSVDEWETFAASASLKTAERKALELGISVDWDMEMVRTPEGYYQIRGGIPTAIAKSLAVAPYADVLWMETKTANLEEAKEFAEAIHAVYPDKMLAYNLSPSFNWDTTGMTEEEMAAFPDEIGKLGYVFNFITYGGHQIDGLAADEFSNSLLEDGMLALARVQRKLRLLDSPYKTPQSHVGGPRLDAALAATTGRTATTKAMGKGSTQFQHLVQTELPTSLLAKWLKTWSEKQELTDQLSVQLKPHSPGSYILELAVFSGEEKVANVVFTSSEDRNQTQILNVRDQNTFSADMRQKRLMTLLHLFLVNRYKSDAVHYLTPTEDNRLQTQAMQKRGLYSDVRDEIGQIIVAMVAKEEVKSYISQETKIEQLIGQ